MRRRRNPDVKDWLVIGGLAAGAYILYQIVSKTPKVLKAGADAIAAPIADDIIWWNQLLAGPPMSVPGNLVLPDGSSRGPLSTYTVRTDPAGNVYTLIGGNLYQIGQSDADGNWPVQLVLDPNFGVTGAGW